MKNNVRQIIEEGYNDYLEEKKDYLPTIPHPRFWNLYEEKMIVDQGSWNVESRKIWGWYRNAMSRRRPESVLEEDRFVEHISNHARWFGCDRCGFVFGNEYEGGFLVSHFAPRNQIRGLELIEELWYQERAVIFAVTSDMVGMLERMGWQKVYVGYITHFRNELVEKTILTQPEWASEVCECFSHMISN